MENLIYQTNPSVTFLTNKFVNVPIILQFDDTPLISIIKEQNIGFTTEIPIYHNDGTYLAKIIGTRSFKNKYGEKAGIIMRSLKNITVCEMDGKTLFEIHHEEGDKFRAQAELYTPSGYFIKCDDTSRSQLIKSNGEALQVGGLTMSNCTFFGCRIGVWMKSDGNHSVACN